MVCCGSNQNFPSNIRGVAAFTLLEVILAVAIAGAIEGKANTINELNVYTKSLSQSGKFQLVGEPKYITRDSKTSFTVTLDYTHNEPEAAETEGVMTP